MIIVSFPIYVKGEKLWRLKSEFDSSIGTKKRKLMEKLDDLANELQFGSGLYIDADNNAAIEDCNGMLRGFGADCTYELIYGGEDLY